MPVGVNPFTITLYAEGVHESSGGTTDTSDLTFKFTPTLTPQAAVEKEVQLLVTPVITAYSTSIPQQSVNFKSPGPPVDGVPGLKAGVPAQLSPDGQAKDGITITASVVTGGLTMKFVQDMLSVTNGANGSGAGAVYVAGSGIPNRNFLPKPGSGLTYPALDSNDPNDPTSYPDGVFTSTPTVDGVDLKYVDSPSTGPPASDGQGLQAMFDEATKADKVDVKYKLRNYVVVRYDDGSIYSVSYQDWSVNFYATTNAIGRGVTVLNAASKVATEGGLVRTNDDPLATGGPIFNGNVSWQ